MVEIISIGDELLIGQVINTNAAWMAEELNAIGFDVRQITCISDHPDEIQRALAQAEDRASVVLMTGGLGPTKDDITKDVLCNYFSTQLVLNEDVLENIRSFFQRKGLPLTELNRNQALVPESAIVIDNPMGTAPGLAFKKPGKLFVAMPGVPYEMKHIMESYVLPELPRLFAGKTIVHKTILTQGIGESFLAKIIADWENSLMPDVKLAYLPSPGIVRLRLTIKGEDKITLEKKLEEKVDELRKLIPEYIWGEGRQTLEDSVGSLLLQKGLTVATAESCTGGYIAHRITSVPGSSAYFKGSVVAYDNQVKETILGLSSQLIQSHGAVSREVAEAMAVNLQQLMKTDFAVSSTGVAGPAGGTEEKPVGTVWIAVASENGVVSKKFLFGDERQRNIHRSSTSALALLREELFK